MEFREKDLEKYIFEDKHLILSQDFFDQIPENENEVSFVEINKNISLHIQKANIKQNKVEFNKCKFTEVWITGCVFSDLYFNDCEISKEFTAFYIKPPKFFIDSTTIKTFWTNFSTYFGGLVFRNNSIINKIYVWHCKLDDDITIVKSRIEEDVTFQTTQLYHLEIRDASFVKKLNLFKSTFFYGVDLYQCEVNELTIHESDFLKADSKNLSFKNGLKIIDTKNLEQVQIIGSTIETETSLSLDSCKLLKIIASKFNSFAISHWESKIKIYDSVFNGDAYFGINRIKVSKKFILKNTIFNGRVNLWGYQIIKKFVVASCSFNKYPATFSNIEFAKNCKTDFSLTNFSNCIFENIDFSEVHLRTFNIENAEFKDCTWGVVNEGKYSERFVVGDEKSETKLPELERIKLSYSQLKKYFYERENYIDGGKFYISQQEINRRILELKNESFKLFILNVHRKISYYGESVSAPFLWMFLATAFFALVYLFTGFEKNNIPVSYELSLDLGNWESTLIDFTISFILSLKNIVPISIESDFFVQISSEYRFSQVISFTQKLINIVLLGSLINSITKFIKK